MGRKLLLSLDASYEGTTSISPWENPVTNLEKLIRGELWSDSDLARIRKKLSVYWSFVEGLASLSCCKRTGVGCMIVRPDLSEVFAVGYNGPAVGRPNDSCLNVEGACSCCHAEQSAISKLKTEQTGLVMLTTTLQCSHCANAVINSARVSYVIYGREYRDENGVRMLRQSGLIVEQYSHIASDDADVPL